MQNVKLCIWLLERILKIKIREIRYPETEKSIDLRQDSKSVRLDVYVEDEARTVYNIEMQTTKGRQGELAKRARYYQGLIDMDQLTPGIHYTALRPTFIIFICTFDLFGLGERIYTFRNHCIERPEVELGDETRKIFVNAKGSKGAVDEDFEDFLNFIEGQEPHREIVKEIAREVENVKNRKEMRRAFVTRYMENLEYRREGIEEGRAQTLLTMAKNMLRNGMSLETVAKVADVSEKDILDLAAAHGVQLGC